MQQDILNMPPQCQTPPATNGSVVGKFGSIKVPNPVILPELDDPEVVRSPQTVRCLFGLTVLTPT